MFCPREEGSTMVAAIGQMAPVVILTAVIAGAAIAIFKAFASLVK